jgi:hypothetical protein
MRTLGFVRRRVVPERFLAVQLEDARRQEATLRIGLAPIEVDDEPQASRAARSARRRHPPLRGFG